MLKMATKYATKKPTTEPRRETTAANNGAEEADDAVPQFHEFGLDDRLVKAIAKLGWREPTLVQARAIPLGLDGKDVLARARTGSGKTAAFLIPMLHNILLAKRAAATSFGHKTRSTTENSGENAFVDEHAASTGFLALILLPSKELCKQATNNIRELLSCCMLGDVTYADLSAQASEQAQKSALAQRPDVIVATPAKVLHYLSTQNVDLKPTLKFLIVDEADLMFSFGYETEMNAIMQHLPKICQVMMTSATLSEDVIKLKRLLLHNAVVLRLEESQLPDVEHLSQYHIKCASEDDKFLILCTLFKLGLVFGKSIIFVNTVDRCYKVKLFLQQFGIRSCTLNSELPVNSRSHIIEQFNDGVYQTLVASDEQSLLPRTSVSSAAALARLAKQRSNTGSTKLKNGEQAENDAENNNENAENSEKSAEKRTRNLKTSPSNHSHINKRVSDKEFGVSRGVDFRHVSNIINFDFPLSANAYIHRVGRTARGDNKGTALSFVLESAEQMKLLRHVEETLESLFSTAAKKDTDSTADRRSVFKPYHFRMDQVEGFRYRTNDALRAVTKVAIREARLREIRSELLASQKLRSYFEANPREFKMLRHDRELHTVQQQPELRHVPEYLVPPLLKATTEQAAAATSGRKVIAAKKRTKTGRPSAGNPLKTFKFEGLAQVVGKEQAKGGKRNRKTGGHAKKRSKKQKTA